MSKNKNFDVIIGNSVANKPDARNKLPDLDDVKITDLAVGDVLQYAAPNWVNVPASNLAAPSGGDGGNQFSLLASESISSFRVIAATGSGTCKLADPTISAEKHRLLGISINAAAINDAVTIQTGGILTEIGWSWDTSLPIFLGSNGTLTQVAPTTGYSVIIGHPISATSLLINMVRSIQL